MINKTSKNFIYQANNNFFTCRDILRIKNKNKIIYINFQEIDDYYNLTRYKYHTAIRKLFMMPEDVIIKLNLNFIKSKGIHISQANPNEAIGNWDFDIITNKYLNVYTLDWQEYVKLSKAILAIRKPLWKYKGTFLIICLIILLLALALFLGFWYP